MQTAARRVLVIGAGPAGMQAALSAAEVGARVTLVDSAPALGGQIWRGERSGSREASRLFCAVRQAAAGTTALRLLTGCTIVDAPEPGKLLGLHQGQPQWLAYDRLIVATGARELFLPFPGWTLPNVFGAGGMQALVKGGLPVEGKRVVVAGSGPLLWSVAAYLRSCGADVLLLAEQASLRRLAAFSAALRFLPGKAPEALDLLWRLRGSSLRTSCFPVRAHGDGRLQAVTLRAGDSEWTIDCDYLACGFGLVPNLELPLLLGCALRNGYVAVDAWQQTSLPEVYCAGEPTGIGGVERSIAEGAIAGLAAASNPGDEGIARKAAVYLRRRRRCHRFAAALDRHFALREELRCLAENDTIVCRCEDVTFGILAGHRGWRSAKLHERLGMGHCQGRVCGAATTFLKGWPMESVRPPLYPVSVEVITAMERDGQDA